MNELQTSPAVPASPSSTAGSSSAPPQGQSLLRRLTRFKRSRATAAPKATAASADGLAGYWRSLRGLSGLNPQTDRPSSKINLALQGGGAHGALTWGMLDALLEDPAMQFEGLSGSSAGTMNAVVLAN